MTTFDISKDLEQFLPSTSEDEKAALRESLRSDGCLNPLTVWQERKVLVDGHNRYRICVELGIPFTITERSFPDIEAVKEWMLVQQLCRRNLSDQHRKWCLGKLYESRKSRKGGQESNNNAKKPMPQNGAFVSSNVPMSEHFIYYRLTCPTMRQPNEVSRVSGCLTLSYQVLPRGDG